MSYRIFELPLALCPAGTPAIQILCQRGDSQTSIGQLWLGKNFALSGSPPDSYGLLQTFSKFAWHGTLKAAYPAATLCIDSRIGATITLDGPDLILDEASDFDALGGAYWVFIDDEILFLMDPFMTALNTYLIKTVRGQFGTAVEDHAAGVDVYIIRATDFNPISFATLLPGNVGQFKVTLGVQNVADQTATAPGYTGAMFTIAQPHLVTVNGIINTPIIPVATNFTIAWSAPAINGTLPPQVKVSTLIEIMTATSIYSLIVASPSTSQLITWADLPADANCGFTLQATTQVDTGDEIISGPADSFIVAVSGPGLIGQYFNDPTDTDGSVAFTQPVVLTRVDANINFDYSSGSPGGSVTAANWSAIWTGILLTTGAAGSYALTLNVDDGARLYINGVLIVDNFGFASGSLTENLTLAANTRYAIVVKYWQGPGQDIFNLEWQPPGAGSSVAIPTGNLFTA